MTHVADTTCHIAAAGKALGTGVALSIPANATTARVIREAETWAAGAQQGRRDVISIMPLLIASQEKSTGGQGTAATDNSYG